MKPWLSIWVKPRQTIRQIVETNPKRFVLFLAMSAGAANGLIQAIGLTAGRDLPTIALIACAATAAGALFGFLGLYLWGWLYRWVGSWFGGQAKNVEVRAAIAWVEIPTFVVFGMWMFLLLLSGGHMLTAGGEQPGNVRWTIFWLVFGLVAFVAGVWRVVLACHTLGEVHRFSAWKGLGTLVIPNLMISIPVFFIALLAAIAIPNVLRGMIAANESMAIWNLRSMVASLSTWTKIF